MKDWINENPMTALLYVIFLIIAVPGAILVIQGDMSYEDYTTRLVALGGAVGILGAGKAVKNGLKGAPPATDDGLPPSDVKKNPPARKPTTRSSTRATSK
jgi:hypothetical protein